MWMLSLRVWFADLDNPDQQKQRLKQHAWNVVRPSFQYFQEKFTGQLAHQVQLLKLARLCHPIWMREIHPNIADLYELQIFKCISVQKPLVHLPGLKDELPHYLALTEEINIEHFDMEHILPFFRAHKHDLPNWGMFASVLAAQQSNSAGVERVFSVLKQSFDETQESALNDYVTGVVMKRYNNRKKN